MLYDPKLGQHWFKLNPSKERLEKLWGDTPTLELWKSYQDAINTQLMNEKFPDLKTLGKFIARKGNNIHFYSPRPMVISEAPEVELEKLYQLLVL
jgi:hypothetical protein